MLYSFYAGCYTKNLQDRGIHLISLDTSRGELRLEGSYYGGESPSFLIRSGNFLYAANEINRAGKVSALSVGTGGALAFLNSREVSGAGTCHLAAMNGFLYAANYASGGIFGVKILDDGSLGGIATEIQHNGTGPNPRRQQSPHAHSVNPVPPDTGGADKNDGRLIAADLGADKLFCYQQRNDGSLIPDSKYPAAAAPAGAGPRHMAFHPGAKRVYAVMEMGVSVVCYKITETGLEMEAEYPLIEGSFSQADTAADVHLSADGKKLYASIRGKNLLSVFEVSGNASLRLMGSYPTSGESPRNFCLTAKEDFVVIAHNASGHITVCPVGPDGTAGKALCSLILPGASCVINADL